MNINKSALALLTLFFYGESNVQKAGELLRVQYPHITVGHGAERVVFFFSGVCKKASNM
jgi:hypothetical protein